MAAGRRNGMNIHLKKLRRTQKVRNKILLIFIVAAIVPILLVGSISIIQLRNQMLNHYDEQLDAECTRVNSILFDITTTMYTSSESIISTQECMKLFGAKSAVDTTDSKYQDVTSDLTRLKQNTASIASLKIYTNNPNVPENNYIQYTPSFKSQDWYPILSDKGWNHWGSTTSTRIRQKYYELTLVRRVGTVSSRYSAYLVLKIDNNHLKNRMNQYSYTILSSINHNPVYYSTDRNLFQTDFPFQGKPKKDFYSYSGRINLAGKEQLAQIVSFRPYGTKDMIYTCISAGDAYDNINNIILTYVLVLFISIAVPALVICLFSFALSRRITILKTAMHQASEGDYNIIDDLKGDDELSDAFTDLKRTVNLIRQKEAEIYQAQINEQLLINKQLQMEYKMLASQINPHFLYNTLETIRMQSLSSGNRDVAHSIKLLGKAMHYVLENSGTNSTTLDRELSYIETYCEIQKLRFGNRFTFSIVTDDGIQPKDYQILPLLLQPVVENAVVHGLEAVQSDGRAQLHISIKNDVLWITIQDNGCGIDPETLAQIQYNISHHNPEDARSIGLYNINQRIKLRYGDEFGMQIDSIQGAGTTVTLSIPAQNINTD